MIKEMVFQALKNVSIKLSLKGAAGAVAVGFVSGAAAYGVHEYFDFKKKELEFNRLLSQKEPEHKTQNSDDGDNDSLPEVA